MLLVRLPNLVLRSRLVAGRKVPRASVTKGRWRRCVRFKPRARHRRAFIGTVHAPAAAQRSSAGRRPEANPVCFAGRAYARTLQQAAVPLLPRRRCAERYQGRFTGRMLCAGSLHGHSRVDSCQGDSGGPLVCERPGASWAVYGVTSWGYGCGAKGSPGVYTKVSAFVPWIKSVTKL